MYALSTYNYRVPTDQVIAVGSAYIEKLYLNVHDQLMKVTDSFDRGKTGYIKQNTFNIRELHLYVADYQKGMDNLLKFVKKVYRDGRELNADYCYYYPTGFDYSNTNMYLQYLQKAINMFKKYKFKYLILNPLCIVEENGTNKYSHLDVPLKRYSYEFIRNYPNHKNPPNLAMGTDDLVSCWYLHNRILVKP